MLTFENMIYWKSTSRDNFGSMIYMILLKWSKCTFWILEIFEGGEEILESEGRKPLYW